MEPRQWLNDEEQRIRRIEAAQEIIGTFLDEEVILDDADYRGYDTTGVAARIVDTLFKQAQK